MPLYDVAALVARNPEAAGGFGANPADNLYGLTAQDLLVVLALFQEHRPKRVLEFGVNHGDTAAFLLGQCPWIELYCGVDLDPKQFGDRGIVPKQAGDKATGDARFVAVLTNETVPGFHDAMIPYREPFDAII